MPQKQTQQEPDQTETQPEEKQNGFYAQLNSIHELGSDKWKTMCVKAQRGVISITEGMNVNPSIPQGVVIKITEISEYGVSTTATVVPNARIKEMTDRVTGDISWSLNIGN